MSRFDNTTMDPGPPGVVTTEPSGPEEVPAGTLAGEHVIESVIGRGGSGVVYLARRRGDGQAVAIKMLTRVLTQTPSGVERFLREVTTVQRLRHPNIVEIHEVGRLPDERPYYAMELLQGTNLRRWLGEHGRMTPADSLPVVEAICAGLSCAHAAGVVHRDLKAENVMVSGDRIKLVDFGIVKLLEPDPDSASLTLSGQFLGTPVAMAPEQIQGGVIDQRVDIYALGVLIYQLLTGEAPFKGSLEDLIQLHLCAPPPAPSASVPVPAAIDAVVLRCLAKDPGARYQTVAAVLEAYREAVTGTD
jgi:serine/threonine-protein kinase